MRYVIFAAALMAAAAFACCCTDEPAKPGAQTPPAAGAKDPGVSKPEAPPPAPAKKWACRDGSGNYKVEYTEADHPLKARSRGRLGTLRTYTAVPAPAKGKMLVAVFDTEHKNEAHQNYRCHNKKHT